MTSLPTPPGAAFSHETALRALDNQLRRIGSLDSKAGILLAAGGVLTGLIASGRSSLLEAPTSVALLGGIFLFGSLILAVIAFANRRYRSGLSPETVTQMASMDETWIKWRFQGNLLESWKENNDRLRRKAALVTGALLSLLLAIVNIGIHFGIVIIGGNQFG